MFNIINSAIKKGGLTQEAVASSCGLSRSAFLRKVNGEQAMTPDDAVVIADAINLPQLTHIYCQKSCSIGQKYCFPILNNVNLDIVAGLVKYRQEVKESLALLDEMIDITMNKRDAEDYTPDELAFLNQGFQQMHDVEHTLETVKMQSWRITNVEDGIKVHNKKVYDKKYAVKDKPEIRVM